MLTKTTCSVLACMLSVVALACSQQQPRTADDGGFDPSKSDAQALQVVDEMWTALGGKENWQNVRYLSYHWIVARDGKTMANYRHDWDRYTDSYRVEGTNRKGQHYVALFNTQTKEGDVYIDGDQMPEDSVRTKMMQEAYARFVNDSYWLIMPYKLNDPGVILRYDGEKEIDGQRYDVVRVTFENVGLTPGDIIGLTSTKATG